MKNLISCQIIAVVILFTAEVSGGSAPEYWPTWRGPNMMGEREFDMSFEGKIEESKLVGELTTSRGTRKVKGTRLARRFRRR